MARLTKTIRKAKAVKLYSFMRAILQKSKQPKYGPIKIVENFTEWKP